MTNEYGNELLHKVLLSAMKDIDKICRENGLKYYLYAGTLLGAVNHKGFIPWDDDVDIVMFPEDFDQLKQIIESDYSDRYRIENWRNSEKHYSLLNKFLINGGKIIYSDGTQSEIFIDLSVLYGVPNSRLSRYLQRFELEMLDKITSVKSGSIIPTSLISKVTIGILAKLPKMRICTLRDFIVKRFDKNNCANYALMVHLLSNPYTGMNGYDNDMVSADLLKNPQYIPFEDTQFMVYSDPIADLTRRYGFDFAKPYPEEKRVSKHSIVGYEISEELMERISK